LSFTFISVETQRRYEQHQECTRHPKPHPSSKTAPVIPKPRLSSRGAQRRRICSCLSPKPERKQKAEPRNRTRNSHLDDRSDKRAIPDPKNEPVSGHVKYRRYANQPNLMKSLKK
jgi:hypothetical protein